ncbi:unnamed protein product, partial [Durusdinium trenchii]
FPPIRGFQTTPHINVEGSRLTEHGCSCSTKAMSLCQRLFKLEELVPERPGAAAEDSTVSLESTVNSIKANWMVQLSVEPQTPVTVISRLIPSTLEGHQCCKEVIAGPDGVISGVCEFHFLRPSQEYTFWLGREGSKDALLQRSVTTARCGRDTPFQMAMLIPPDMWTTYVGPEHQLGSWLGSCPEDMVWTVKPSFELLRALWRNACFTLPSRGSPITQCPNPISRYCLDLTKGQPWLRSKKVRRHKGDFRLTVNADYQQTFKHCERVHVETHRSTWITPDLIRSLDQCRQDNADLKVYSIELWEKSTGQLAAAIMALSIGDVFHDYTMATMIRDSRSAGAVLTKVVGQLLTEAGYTLWYWGYKNPYMAEYDGQYGGLLMNNEKDFWPRWRRAMDLASTPATPDLAQRVPAGGIDLSLL